MMVVVTVSHIYVQIHAGPIVKSSEKFLGQRGIEGNA
jgi:hypothetical protein